VIHVSDPSFSSRRDDTVDLRMDFGLFNLMTLPSPEVSPGAVFAQMRTMVQMADQGDFEIAWMTEHHLSNYCISTSPLLLTAHMAGFTKRIKIGPAVVVLPFYDPLRLIEDIFVTDHLLDGRFVLGLGTGYQPREFMKFGTDIGDRVGKGLEVWDALWMAQQTGRIDFDGKYVHIQDAVLPVPPLQRPIPTFAVGTDPAFRRRVVEYGATPLCTPGLADPSTTANARALIDETRAALGRSTGGNFAVQRYVFVTDSPTEARQAAEEMQRHGRLAANIRQPEPDIDGAFLGTPEYAGEPSIDDILKHALIGSADDVAERIVNEAATYGISHLSVFMQFASMPYERTLQSLERFITDVIPAVRKSRGTKP
jgi:alkanesulfonate monooxygenase SsuD/methylene tetrahydromethanopterin reductase-like flavin-dependent oxidoreductase (luciferase family)